MSVAVESNPFYKRSIIAGDYVDPVYVEECSFHPQFPHNLSVCRAPGIAVELLLFMSAVLNFKVTLVKVSSMTELFAKLHTGQIDMSIDVKQLTPERTVLADYATFPYDNLYNYQLVMKSPRPSIALLHSAPVDLTIWSLVISTAGVFWTIRMGLSVWNGNRNKLRLTTAFVTGLHGIVSAVSLGLYANLLALALYRNDHPAILNAEIIAELLLKKQLRLIVSRNDTQMYNSFVCPTEIFNSSLLANLQQSCRSNPPLVENDVELVMRRYLNGYAHVYVVTHGQLEVLKARYNHFVVIDSGISSQFKSYFFAKGSKLNIPLWLVDSLKIRSTQLLAKYGKLYAEEKRNCPYQLHPLLKPPLPLSLSQVQLIFWWLLIGVLTGLINYFVEKFRNRRSVDFEHNSSVAKLADSVLITLGYRVTPEFYN